MVCSTDRSKAVVPVLVLLFVVLWFILRGDLLYVFPCVILFLCFSILLVLRLPRLGKRELILVLFVRLFGLCLFRFVGFLFLLRSGKGCGLWLWHSLGCSLTFFEWIYQRLGPWKYSAWLKWDGQQLTRSPLMTICLSEGSNSSNFGSMSIGDWFLPLVHMNQSLFNRPQKTGPEIQIKHHITKTCLFKCAQNFTTKKMKIFK